MRNSKRSHVFVPALHNNYHENNDHRKFPALENYNRMNHYHQAKSKSFKKPIYFAEDRKRLNLERYYLCNLAIYHPVYHLLSPSIGHHSFCHYRCNEIWIYNIQSFLWMANYVRIQASCRQIIFKLQIH